MRKLILASAVAIAVGLVGGAANAQAMSLSTGWHYLKPTNCLLLPGAAATASAPAGMDTFYIFVDVDTPSGAPNAPPPPPNNVQFNTTDPTVINLAGPFCMNGTPFYGYWDGTKMQYFSIYPHLGG